MVSSRRFAAVAVAPVSLVEKDWPAGENQNYSFFKYSSSAFFSHLAVAYEIVTTVTLRNSVVAIGRIQC